MEFIRDICASLIANAFFTIIVVLFGWIIFLFTKRKKIVNFFNIKNSKRIVVYLSTLFVEHGGSSGYDGKRRAYRGTTVVLNELLVANKFRDLMNYIMPSLSDHSSILSKILLSDIKVSIISSPRTIQEIDSSTTIISLGSPGYNIVSKFIEEHKRAICKFENDNTSFLVTNMPQIKDGHNGFVQKIYDAQSDRSFFYTAGLSEIGTIGAANFLANEWPTLNKKFGSKKSFLVMLRFQDTEKWTIDFEREIIN